MPIKTFISYHHANDQWAKEQLVAINTWHGVFDDYSVNSGEIDDEYLTDEQIRVIVRDNYLRDATVTLVLVGTETRYRKHVDWELFSSMRNTELNPKSGVILVPLPGTGITYCTAAHGMEEKQALHPEISSWTHWSRQEHEERYPYFSTRMIDNLATGTARMSVIPWDKLVSSVDNLKMSIELAHRDRELAIYDFTTSMRRRNGTGPRR